MLCIGRLDGTQSIRSEGCMIGMTTITTHAEHPDNSHLRHAHAMSKLLCIYYAVFLLPKESRLSKAEELAVLSHLETAMALSFAHHDPTQAGPDIFCCCGSGAFPIYERTQRKSFVLWMPQFRRYNLSTTVRCHPKARDFEPGERS